MPKSRMEFHLGSVKKQVPVMFQNFFYITKQRGGEGEGEKDLERKAGGDRKEGVEERKEPQRMMKFDKERGGQWE